MTKDKEELEELGRANNKGSSALQMLFGAGPSPLPLAAIPGSRPTLTSNQPGGEGVATSAEEALADAFGFVDVNEFQSCFTGRSSSSRPPTDRQPTPQAQAAPSRMVPLAEDAVEEEEEADEEVLTFVDLRLRESADAWPPHAPPPPTSAEQAVDAEGTWSATGPSPRDTTLAYLLDAALVYL